VEILLSVKSKTCRDFENCCALERCGIVLVYLRAVFYIFRGSDEQKEKNKGKADRLIEDMKIIKVAFISFAY